MEKKTISQTLKQLQKANLADLQTILAGLQTEPVDPKFTKAVLLEKILELAEPAAPPAKASLGENQFEYDGKTYQVVMPQVNIPGIGVRTALEICVDTDAQGYLVKEKATNSVIKELV